MDRNAQLAALATEATADGESVDEDAAPMAYEKGQTEGANAGGGGTTYTFINREYIWGPGDGPAGVDELLVQYDRQRWAWWILQDAGGDIVAQCDLGGNNSTAGPARVVAQWTYDAYGAALTAEHLTTHSLMHAGHKALFFDRLDVGVAESSGTTAMPRLVPFAHTLVHNRNRAYIPALGRFLQADPNATAMALLEATSYHGRGTGAIALAFSTEERYGDGMNLYQYLGSNPWTRSDPLGLSYDPFDAVDDYLEEAAAERSAFLTQIGQDLQAVAIVTATIATYLPFPVASIAGEFALALLNGEDLSQAMVSASVGLIPGGRLGMTASKLSGAASRIGSRSLGLAAAYGAKHGAPKLKGATRLAQRGLRATESIAEGIFGGPATHVVYLAIRNGTPVYVGITSQLLGARKSQHNGKRNNRDFDDLVGITPSLPYKLALAIETVIMLSNPHFENRNQPIATGNPIFDAAIAVAQQWIGTNGLKTKY